MSSNGLLNLNKPPGVTSRRVVDHVARLERGLKVGHAGTLDPLASGVLVLCVGSATRLIEYVQRMPKRYSATFLLGRRSPTEDIEGEVLELSNPPVPSLDEIRQTATRFVGEIRQRPPAYSALKVQGRRAYDLARKGRDVELEPRTIVIHRIDVVGYEYPELQIEVECGSGTYIRSLGRDLAQAVGTMSVMSALVRTAIGGFRVEDARGPDSLNKENWRAHLLPSQRAVENLPRITLDRRQVQQIILGQAIRAATSTGEAPEIAALDEDGHLIALLTPRGPGLLRPKRVLATA